MPMLQLKFNYIYDWGSGQIRSIIYFSTANEKVAQTLPQPQGGKKYKWTVEMKPPPPTFLQNEKQVQCKLFIKQQGGNNSSNRVQKTLRTFKFIFGEVWFCAGQSNMNWPMSKLVNAGPDIAKGNKIPS